MTPHSKNLTTHCIGFWMLKGHGLLTSLGTEENSFVFASLGSDFTLLALFTFSPFVLLPGPPCPSPKPTPKMRRWERNALTDKAFPHEGTSAVSFLTKGEWDGDVSEAPAWPV